MGTKIIDLTFQIHEGMQTFSGHWHPVVEITQLGRHGIENRETRKLTLGTHTGTHIDAPRHFIPGGKTVDQIPLSQLMGPATFIDLSHAKPFQEISHSDLEAAVKNNPVERLIVRFDWDLRFGTRTYYTDHPFFSEDACQWLVDHGCKVLALDTPQPDNPKNSIHCSKDAPNHKILLNAEVVIVEYLTNLRAISHQLVELVVAPLNIREGDGAPARCFVIENH